MYHRRAGAIYSGRYDMNRMRGKLYENGRGCHAIIVAAVTDNLAKRIGMKRNTLRKSLLEPVFVIQCG